METSQEAHPAQPFSFESEAATFGLRERERVRRLLLRRKLENWIGTIVVIVLAGCAVWALTSTKVTLSDAPSIQGFRAKN
ncbi:MAG TPA: hypothetical protein VH374_15450 [Polyangia bacterium]|nr:hypothetical protein [Polyangia bacterium]